MGGFEETQRSTVSILELTDWVLPKLKPYEFSLYVLLLRLSLDDPIGSIRVGKRTIAERLGQGTRNSRGNYQHISEKLEALHDIGAILIGDTNRAGTAYTVLRPGDVPAFRPHIVDNETVPEPDYFANPALRIELYERDGWRCTYCGDSLDPQTATLDHRVPQSKGGDNSARNLTASCLMCNSVKGNRTEEEAARDLLRSIADRRRTSG